MTWLLTEPVDLLLAVGRIFRSVLRNELKPSTAGELTILDPRMKEAGIALRESVFRGGELEFKAYVAICDVAMPSPIDPEGP